MLQIEESVTHGAGFAAAGLQPLAGAAPQASALPRDTAAAPATDAKFCSIDNPECESCQ